MNRLEMYSFKAIFAFIGVSFAEQNRKRKTFVRLETVCDGSLFFVLNAHTNSFSYCMKKKRLEKIKELVILSYNRLNKLSTR